MKLGKNILKLRKQQGLSQEQLGEKVNVTRQTISNWELDETTPNPDQLKLLSKALNISIDDLLDNDVKNVLEEKISNTEKLAGIIIKVLKIFGIVFICYIIFIIIVILGLGIYTFNVKDNQNVESSATTICSIDKKKYQITFGTDDYFKCDKCSDKMNNDLKELVDFEKIDESLSNIEKYFKDNNGTCD